MSVSVQTKDLSSNVDDELSPLDMERKFLVCKAPQDTDATTPDTVDSIVMTFSDDSDDDGKFKEESKDFNDLPVNAKTYIDKLEDLLETPITMVSTGPERRQLIFKAVEAVA